MVIATLIDELNRRRTVALSMCSTPDSYLLCAGMLFCVQPWEVPKRSADPILVEYRQRAVMDVSAFPVSQ
jgi:hypothetical protein